MIETVANAEWGIVAPPVVEVLRRLQQRAAEAMATMDPVALESHTPTNYDECFIAISAAAETADRATRDYRSIFNAYTHKFHLPRPPIGELASAQGTITQSFARRYTDKTVEAVKALLSDTPDLEALRAGIRTLGFNDLQGISPQLDQAIATARQDPQFTPWESHFAKRERIRSNRPQQAKL